jgi:hypothetical protein
VSPSLRFRRLIARLGKLENRAASAQRKILQQARREILAELALGGGGFRTFQLRNVLAVITRYVDSGKGFAERAASVHTRQAWHIGIQMAEAGLGKSSLFGISSELLDALVEVTQDQVRGVWSELGSKLKSTVRRVTLGIDDPLKAMGTLMKVIRDPKGFGNAGNRAEAIVRTEVNRTFSSAQQKRLEQAVSVGVKARKWWLSAEDRRVRPDHVAAANRYPRTAPIPVGQPFIVGGESLMYPLDPRASAEQAINCRCVSVASVEG